MKTELDRNNFVSELLIISLAAFMVFYVMQTGTSRFSADSWAYFELSKSVFSGDFYSFNTYRSYAFDGHSAAFPFGLPVLLAIANLVVESPLNAVWINLLAATGTCYLIVYVMGARWKSPELAGLLALSLLCNFQYLDEVMSGRAMPLTVLCYVAAFSAFFGNRAHGSLIGFFLGLACLFRFDAVLIGGAFSLGLIALRPKLRFALEMWFGMAIGLMPWVVYSLIFFGGPLASDNSWISKNVFYAFVLDYPAVASKTVFSDPDLWFNRVFGNFRLLPEVVWKYLCGLIYPLPLAAMALIACLKQPSLFKFLIATFLVVVLGLSPFALTGYLDPRYFTPHLLLWTGSCLWMSSQVFKSSVRSLALLGLGAALVAPVSLYWSMAKQAQAWTAGQAETLMLIEKIRVCQVGAERKFAYLFDDGALAAEYGARTGEKAFMTPRNFDEFDFNLKAQFEQQYGRLIRLPNTVNVNNFECKPND